MLIAEVVDSIRDALDVKPWNWTGFSAGEDSERVIWSDLDRHSIDESPRLVVVRQAEKLVHTDRLIDWIKTKAQNPRTYAIFVSSDERAATVPSADKGAKPILAPHLKAFERKGTVVECRPFTAATAKHAKSWVIERGNLRDNVAGHLLNRANGDVRLVRDLCLKLRALDIDASIPDVNTLLAQRPRETFSEALLALRRKEALLALERLSEDDYSREIGFLDSSLDLAGLVYTMTSQHATRGEMTRAAGNQGFLIPVVESYAKHYGPDRRNEIRQALAVADEALRGGNRVGVMEALCARW